MLRMHVKFLASLGFVAFLCVPATTFAQVAPPLGTAAAFGALGNSGVTGSTGLGTSVAGEVGSSPTPSIPNFPPSRTAPPLPVPTATDSLPPPAPTHTTPPSPA